MSVVVLLLIFIAPLANSQVLNFLQDHVQELNATITENRLSGNCSVQLRLYLAGLLSLEPRAWQMFDASTKIPVGLLKGNFYDLGNFDECLDVEAKYCLGTLGPRNFKKFQTRMLGNDPKFTGMHFSTCLPNKCTAEDASILFPLIHFDEKYCYSKETQPRATWGTITTIALLGFFLLLALISTGYDIFLHYTGIKPGRDGTVAFSFLTNGRKLLAVSTNEEQLLCLNGIKAISMIWIVIAHEYVNGASGAVTNYFTIIQFMQNVGNMFVIGATVAVDTFFVIGGLVTVYAFLKSQEKGVTFNIAVYYIHRYIRLTPALAVVVLVHATLLKHLGDGPLWNSFDDHLVESCRKHWWAALLYIQNYIHDEQACVPQSWYLSIDMQLFFLSPLVLLLLQKKAIVGLMALFGLTAAGIVIPFIVAFRNELRAFLIADKDNVQKYMFSYYEQTYGRFGAYTIGMLLGYLIFQVKKRRIIPIFQKFHIIFFWILSLAGLLACVYAGHGILLAEYSKWSHSCYIAFNSPAWAVCISIIIFLCVAGYGGPVNAFLSAPIFQLLSKLSYSIYLVHYAFILVRTASARTGVRITHFNMIFNFWGDFMFSLAFAAVLCLTFESPMITVEKILFGKLTRRNPGRKLSP